MADKIRQTAKIFWILTIIVCAIMIIAGIAIQSENSGYYGDEALEALGGDLWVMGLILLPVMWLCTILVMGFADIVENTSEQRTLLEKLVSQNMQPADKTASPAGKTASPAREENLNELLPKL